MTVTSADLNQWAAHRHAVVSTVSRQVPGIDPDLAASRGLELLCAELMKQGDVSDPLTFWSTASVDAALRMAHEQALPVDGAASTEATTAPIQRVLDFDVLNTAMERLPSGEQQLLWDHHVGARPVAAIAEEIGLPPDTTERRLRRAENRLASSLAETHAGTTEDLECRSTQTSMHDFVRNRLLPRRRQKVEDHMVQCADCTRAFVDVRESYWMLRAAAPVLLIGAATAAKTGTAAAAGTGIATAGAAGGWFTALGTRAVLAVRAALTDPAGLSATVVSGLFIAAAVTTGVAGDTGAAPSHLEAGTVSVSFSTPDPTKPAARQVAPIFLHEDSTNLPELTGLPLPTPGKKDGTPPGIAKSDRTPPGLARTGSTLPGPAKAPATPPGPAKKDSASRGPAKTPGTPPGPAKSDGARPGPPDASGSRSDTSGSEGARPGDWRPAGGDAGRHDGAGPGRSSRGQGDADKAKWGKDEHPGSREASQRSRMAPGDPAAHEREHDPGRSGQARSRSTSTS